MLSLNGTKGGAKNSQYLHSISKNLHVMSFLVQFLDLRLHFQVRKYIVSLCCSWRGTPCSTKLLYRTWSEDASPGISGWILKYPTLNMAASGEPSSMKGGFPVAISTTVQPILHMSAGGP